MNDSIWGRREHSLVGRKRPPAWKKGGLGVRKRMSEESLRDSYRLNGVRKGQTVAKCHDKYGRWEAGYTMGVIARLTSTNVFIIWQGSEEIKMYSQGDARYEVDRGRWRITDSIQANPLDPTAGPPAKMPESDSASSALTSKQGDGIIDTSPQSSDDETEEMKDMAKSRAETERDAAKKAVANGDLKDRDTYTAKQVATRLGTDPKTMRKFFRSSRSTVEPVGQGGRYEFDAEDLPQIRLEFEQWQGGTVKGTRDSKNAINTPAKKKLQESIKKSKPAPAPEIEEDDEFEFVEVDGTGAEIEDPNEEDLADIEDEDLDDLDLDDL